MNRYTLFNTLLATAAASEHVAHIEHSGSVQVAGGYDDNSNHPYFIEYHGFISDGDDILRSKMTPEQANEVCASMPRCKGFTFQKQCSPTLWECEELIYFKSKWSFIPSSKSAYVSYKRVWTSDPWTKTLVQTENCVGSQGEDCGSKSRRGLYWGCGFFISQLVWLIFACLWKTKVVNNLEQVGPTILRDKEDPPFFAFAQDQRRNPWQCLYAFCCMPSVAAKNYEVTGVCAFWPAYFWLACGVGSCGYPCVAASRAIWSMQLKERMGIDSKLWKECLCSFFCFPCEVGRESLIVDEELGVAIGAPFSVEKVDKFDKVEKFVKDEIDGDGALGEKRVCRGPDGRYCGN